MPIALAAAAALLCVRKLQAARGNRVRIALSLSVLGGLLLVYTHASWLVSEYLFGQELNLPGGLLSWVAFDTLVIALFITLGFPTCTFSYSGPCQDMAADPS